MSYKYGKPDEYGDFPYLYCGQFKDSELGDILEERLPDYYHMQLIDPVELEILKEIVNQGIDAHLEAVTAKNPQGKVIEVKDRDQVIFRKFEFIPDKKGMQCFLRRLNEYLDTCDDDLKWEPAYQLRSCIYETLGIEISI
ncbi:MAG: hypothetical protein DRO67_00630 [Candidatus Asgardarchaeum californiense]|nr:MAG: hypothetical protein DRO67_00630 [Candidatus Asgardarchaeum californiense]